MRFNGHGMVWDPETDSMLCRFNKDGVLDTEDEKVINKLVSLGYPCEGDGKHDKGRNGRAGRRKAAE